MTARVCLDCPTIITTGSRCPHCTRTTTQRGYGQAHQRTRQAWADRQTAGEQLTCWRCGQPITDTAWDLGHDDQDRTITHGPEHITCNRPTATRRHISPGA